MITPPMKFEDNEPLIMTPPADMDDYRKLRTTPYPQQRYSNLPYYFFENKSMTGRPVYESDLEKLPLNKIKKGHSYKIKSLYISLKEEFGFRRYLQDEKKMSGSNAETNQIYDSEISSSNFRINNIKDDINQFTYYLIERYNLKNEIFHTEVEAGLSLAQKSTEMLEIMLFASYCLMTKSGTAFIVWYVIVQIFIVRIQNYVLLTLSRYANGTGMTTWGFCPLLSGLGVTMLISELCYSLNMFAEIPSSIIRAWLCLDPPTDIPCKELEFQSDYTRIKRSKVSDFFVGELEIKSTGCFKEANQFTKSIECKLEDMITWQFDSDYFYLFYKIMTQIPFLKINVFNIVIWISTLCLWLSMAAKVKLGFNRFIQGMHQPAMNMVLFVLITFLIIGFSGPSQLIKDASYEFLYPKNFFSIPVVYQAYRLAVKDSLPFLIELGPKMPYKWSPDGLFVYTAGANIITRIFGTWIAFIAVYHEKSIYKTKDVSCFTSHIYLMNSALPRYFATFSETNFLGCIFYLLHAYHLFHVTVSVWLFIWRNLNYVFPVLEKMPKLEYIFYVIYLILIILFMLLVVKP